MLQMPASKNKIQKSISSVSAFGTVLSLLGLFLPWGVLTWPPGVMGVAPNQVLGFEVLAGDFALMGCILNILFLVQNTRRPVKSKFIFASEFEVAFFSLLWIIGSRNPAFSSSFPPMYYTPMYGAYVSFTGALIALSAIGLGWHLSNRKSK